MDVTRKIIKVDSIADNGKKITLNYGKEKYGFWKTKQDGAETKAYSQFKSMRVEAGQEYPIAVKEEEKSFTNEQGKLINFVERTVMYFATKEASEGHVPVRQEPATSNFDLETLKDLQVKLDSVNLTISNMKIWAKKMEDKQKNLEALVSQVVGKDAVTLHTEVPPKAKVEQVAEMLGGKVDLSELPEGFDK